jgi:hypothetical protein
LRIQRHHAIGRGKPIVEAGEIGERQIGGGTGGGERGRCRAGRVERRREAGGAVLDPFVNARPASGEMRQETGEDLY